MSDENGELTKLPPEELARLSPKEFNEYTLKVVRHARKVESERKQRERELKAEGMSKQKLSAEELQNLSDAELEQLCQKLKRGG